MKFLFLISVSVLLLASVVEGQTIAPMTDIGSSAPTQGRYDVAQTNCTYCASAAGTYDGPDGLNDYTDNGANHGAWAGQTFTTGTNSAGYILTSLSIKTAGVNNGGGYASSQTFHLYLYSVSGGNATLMAHFTSYSSFADGDWVQWNLGANPINLAANSTYAYGFGRDAGGSGYAGLGEASGNPCSGGEIAMLPTAGGAITFGSSHNFDAVFDAGLVLATIPVVNQLAVSPATNVISGTTVAFTAMVTGASPFYFQWQFNDGGGYVNLAGASTNSLTLVAGLSNSGSYRLVLTNSYGAVTSAPVSLTVTLDTNQPVVLQAFNIGNTNVEVDFSKTLDPVSALNPANYVFTNGLAVTDASLSPDGKSVWLVTAPLGCGSNYTLVLNGIRDQATPPNTIATNTTVSFMASPRQRILLDADWRFKLGDPADVTTNVTYYPEIPNLGKLDSSEVSGTSSETYFETNRVDIFATRAGENVSFIQTNYDDSSWRALSLPHDWAVELPFDSSADQNHGYKSGFAGSTSPNTIGWYRHTFTLPAADAGKALWLEFDGVYRNSLVWLNGHLLGRNVSGYSSFYFDVTRYVNPGGTNVLVIRVDASRFEGWFYEGAGIYRHVWLTTENPVHVAQWGTFVYTSVLSGSNATVTIQTEVTNQSNVATSNGTLTSTIYDAASNVVASVTSALNVPTGKGLVATQTVSFTANLWSLQTPYLYNLVTTISNQNAVADIYNTPFGVRTVSIDVNNGISINGQHVEIQGMCNHQDMAGVGIALPDRLQYFRLERLMEMGVNAYRTSHNEPTAELLDACDQLGMLVLDENRRIGTNAEPMNQLTRQIRRDRNHPSVFMWSLGNEESLQGDTGTGAPIAKTMQNAVHAMDSTRLCTIAMNGGWGSGFSTVIDVQGFNYYMNNMDGFHSSYPNQPCIGTEISSAVGDRGVYATDWGNAYVDSYDDSSSGQPAEQWWPFYLARPWASGAFSWTGFDYRGEPYPFAWPSISSHFGTLDTCGNPKDNFYYYQANWSLKPVLHLIPHWTWQTPGQLVNIWAFGNCQAVELFTNGVSLGRQNLNSQGHVEWDNVPFSPGTLQAIGYTYGMPVLTNSVVTAGAPASIAVMPDRRTILADGRDVSVITVAVLDVQGNIVPTATNEIYFSATGGTIIGVGNGDPNSHESDKASQRALFKGLAQVIVQSSVQPGSISLTASSPGLTPTNLTLTASYVLPPPAAPLRVSAVASDAHVVVSWDIVPAATSYNLWRSTTQGGSYTLLAKKLSGMNLGYVDQSVTIGTTYFYVLSAVNPGGESATSAPVGAMVVPLPPGVPSGLTAAMILTNQISLAWNMVTNATGYNVKRSAVNGGPYVTVASGVTSTNYVDTGLAGTTYFYVVSGVNAAGEGTNSAQASATLIPATSVFWTGAINGTWDKTTANWRSNGVSAVFADGDTVVFDDTALTNTTVNLSVPCTATVFANNSALNYTLGGSAIAGPGSLSKSGTGTLTLTNANTYSGGTTVNAGTLSVGPYNSSFSGQQLGIGTVTVGGGTLFLLSGQSSHLVGFAQSFVLNGGTIQSEDGWLGLATGAGSTINVTGPTTLQRKWGRTAGKYLALNGQLTGSAPLTLQAMSYNNAEWASIWITNNANTYNGTLTVVNSSSSSQAAFVLVVGGNTALSNATVNVSGMTGNGQTNNGFVDYYGVQFNTGINAPVFGALSGNGNINLQDFSGSATALTAGGNNSSVNFSGILSGTGSLTKIGTGTLTLLNADTYSGATTVSNGELVVSTTFAGNGNFTVANGATLGVTNLSSSSAQVSNLAVAAGAALEFQNVNSTTIPLLAVGNLTVNGNCVVKVMGASGLAAGNSYPLAGYTGTVNAFANLQLQMPYGWRGSLVKNANQIALANVALVATNAPTVGCGVTNTQLYIKWPADHIGWRLQMNPNLTSTNWTDVSGISVAATNQISLPVSVTNGGVFYRLVYP